MFETPQQIFNEAIKAYRLTFSQQLEFNKDFGIQEFGPIDDSPESLRDFLQFKLNQAFKDQAKLDKYQSAIEDASSPSDRGIHDGFHAASVALYARNLLELCQDHLGFFPDDTGFQICKFYKELGDKARDLEILCLMHDVARVDQHFDQNEYKNAFYVALLLRKMGDERFQGDEISEEGLTMIMDLATKESKEKDKSFMSKLIQSADSLAILRLEYLDVSKYRFEMNDVFTEFSEIDHDNAEIRDKLKRSLKEFVCHIDSLEKNPEFLQSLESAKDPYQSFISSEKAKLIQERFAKSLKILQTDPNIKRLSSHTFDEGLYYTHILSNRSPYPLQKQGQSFLCATALRSGIIIRSLADRSWLNNPALILRSEKKDGIILVTGFKTDVGSDVLFYEDTEDRTNIELSHMVRMFKKESKSYHDKMILTEEELKDKLDDIERRRLIPELDKSSTKYNIYDSEGQKILEFHGLHRYQNLYSRYDYHAPTDTGELKHNEMHILNSLHIDDFVGISKDVFDHLPRFKEGSRLSDSSFFGLLRLNFYKDQINFEKKRLLGLTDPMEDIKFKDCVEFELSRVTNLLEKIAHLNQLKTSLLDLNSPEIDKAMNKRIDLRRLVDGYQFEDTPENRQIYSSQKITKIEKTLEILYSDLEKFEQDDNLGLTGLRDKATEFSTATNIKEKSVEFRTQIMEGKHGSKPLEFAISKVKEGLQKETKMALYDIFNSQEIKILSDEDFKRKITKSPELFKELCERKDYSSILLLFKKDEIEKMAQNTEIKLIDGSELPNFKTIFRKALNLDPRKLALLIKMGLNIYETEEVLCESVAKQKNIIASTFDENTTEDLEIRKLLDEFGINDDISKINNDDLSFDTLEFKNEFLKVLKLYKNESDLLKLRSLIVPCGIKRDSHSFEFKEIIINGYGLLNILNQYPQIENDIERGSYSDQVSINLNKELKIAIKNLRDLRGDTKPNPHLKLGSLITAPTVENGMAP